MKPWFCNSLSPKSSLPSSFFPTASPYPHPHLLFPFPCPQIAEITVSLRSLQPQVCSCPAAGVVPTALPHPRLLLSVLTSLFLRRGDFFSKKRFPEKKWPFSSPALHQGLGCPFNLQPKADLIISCCWKRQPCSLSSLCAHLLRC